MEKVIVYTDAASSGGRVIYPSPQYLADHDIVDIARKDVPAGRPYKIIDAADLPAEDQSAWVINDADLTDGIGGEGGGKWAS